MLGNFRAAIATHAESMAAIISAETGKPSDDALLEVMLAVEHLDWAARNAQKVLRRRRVGAGLISANQSASVGYRPMGVVGVIGPWNYPLYTPMGSIGYALAAGKRRSLQTERTLTRRRRRIGPAVEHRRTRTPCPADHYR